MIQPIKLVKKFYVVYSSSDGMCLSDNGEVEGAYSYGEVRLDGDMQDSHLGLVGKLLFTYMSDCRLFKDKVAAEAECNKRNKKDPEGEYQVLTIEKHEAVLYTLGEDE